MVAVRVYSRGSLFTICSSRVGAYLREGFIEEGGRGAGSSLRPGDSCSKRAHFQ